MEHETMRLHHVTAQRYTSVFTSKGHVRREILRNTFYHFASALWLLLCMPKMKYFCFITDSNDQEVDLS